MQSRHEKSRIAVVSELGVALIAGLALASPAAAQSADPQVSSESPADEIIVTASRRTQAVEDVPYNISVLSGSALESLNVVDVSKLTRTVAGLQLTDRGVRDNGASGRLISRGLNTESAAIADLPFVTAPPVATYVDDTPVFANLRLTDIARVEFLRGPQGTLYGSGSLGGTLRYIHNRPDPSAFALSGEAMASSTMDADGANYSFNGVLNAPLGEHAAFRVSGGRDSYHGYIDAYGRAILGADGVAEPLDPLDPLNSPPATRAEEDVNGAEVTFAHAALRMEPSATTSLQINYHYQEEVGDNRDAQSALPGASGRQVGILLDEPSQRELQLVSLDFGWELPGVTLTSNTSYFEVDSSAIGDGTGLYGALGYLLAPVVTARSNLATSREVFVQELRLVSDAGGAFDWILGAFYQDEDAVELDEHDYFVGDSLLGNPLTGPDDLFLHLRRESNFTDQALFGELTYHISDTWQVTAGARAFRQEFTGFGYFDFPADDFYPGDRNSSEEDGVLFKANTSIDLSEHATAYATFSQGFRRGGANSIPTSGPLAEPLGLVSYDADRVNNYEVGLKGMLSNRMRYSAALYYIDWSDAQVGTLSPVFGYDVAVNAGDATSQGLEFELSGPLTDNLDFSLGYAYTDAHLEGGFSGYVQGAPGARLPGVSEHTLSAALDYVTPLESGAELSYHLDGSYRSDFVNSVDPTAGIYREFDGFAIFAASMTYRRGDWRLTAFAENLFDEDAISAQTDPFENLPDYYVEWGARPRTIGVSLGFNY